MKSKAQIAYEAYCNHTGWKSLATGDNLPEWNTLPQNIRDAWEAAVDAIL